MTGQQARPAPDLPSGQVRPARHALAAAGYVTLEQLTQVTEGDLARIHGVGPKALAQLRDALAAAGLSFATETEGPQRSPALKAGPLGGRRASDAQQP